MKPVNLSNNFKDNHNGASLYLMNNRHIMGNIDSAVYANTHAQVGKIIIPTHLTTRITARLYKSD